MKIGVLPLFNRDVFCNPDGVAELIATVEDEAKQPGFDGLRALLRRTRETIATVRGT